METVRLRLEFDHILHSSLKTKGLDRCWILLKPQLQTISDLSSYILHAFNLQHQCPTGILLSMEDFALPPFESTSLLKDKDVIRYSIPHGYLNFQRVEKVGGVSCDVLMIGNERNCLEAAEISNDEPEKISHGCRSEEEEDVDEQGRDAVRVESTSEVRSVSKKRKASKELKSRKRKKSKPASEDCANVVDTSDNANKEQIQQNGSLTTSKVKTKRLSHNQESSNSNVDESPSPEVQKFISRSAWRKKVKKSLLKNQRRKEKRLHKKSDQQSNEADQPSDQIACQESAEKGNQEVVREPPGKDNKIVHEDRNPQDEDSDEEEDVVPMVIRPGHIRFVPLGEEGNVQTGQNQIPSDNFQWNGITSKKKGQKWGTEKATSHKRNNHKDEHQEQPKVSNGVNYSLDFESLEFYTTLPKEGDVIAYRLIELSSSWTPELSPYRVGKISQYDMRSNRIQLEQVPGYPFFPQGIENDKLALQSEPSVYSEDSSLLTEFSSLVEVRLVEHGKLDSAIPVTNGDHESWLRDEDTATESKTNNGNGDCDSSKAENGTVNPWEEISEALRVKKEQLTQEDNWYNCEILSG